METADQRSLAGMPEPRPRRRRSEHDLYAGERLRMARQLAGCSQQQLGDALGVSFQAVQKYETGENRISASRLYQLARVLNVSLPYFFDGLDETGNPEEAVGVSDLTRKEASMVLGAYYGIKDPRLRSACLLIMTRMADRLTNDSL